MKSEKKSKKEDDITRKEAIKKIGGYGKYAALTGNRYLYFIKP